MTAMLWQPYPERILETPLGQLEIEVYRPSGFQVVMGAGGKPDLEVDAEMLTRRGVPLFKRKGGGGTVLLGPNTIVVTVHAGVVFPFANLSYFGAINRALIEVFRTWKDLDYRPRGISDIAVGDRKLVGSSIYRRKQYLLYQASLLVDLDMALLQLLIKHPPKEPDYRLGRSHAQFLTSFREWGIELEASEMTGSLRSLLPDLVRRELDWIEAKGA